MVLLIGFGNPGRGDDGLGPALARKIERRALPGVVVKIAFQLTVEHALDIANADVVVFADADLALKTPYAFTEVPVGAPGYLDSHNVSPQTVMGLAEQLFGSKARGFILAISGHAFGEVREGLSDRSVTHLELAETFLLDRLKALQHSIPRHSEDSVT